MTLKPSIAGALRPRVSANGAQAQSHSVAESAKPPAPPAPRAGMKSIGFWTSADARKELHRLALDEDKTAEVLMNEALNLLFRAYDRPTIALIVETASGAKA